MDYCCPLLYLILLNSQGVVRAIGWPDIGDLAGKAAEALKGVVTSPKQNCDAGFALSNNKLCEDINECNDASMNDCDHVCENTDGSFKCSCDLGYEAINNTSCSDINECDLSTNRCSQICKNYQGGFECSCKPGYNLDTDRYTCVDKDECLDYLCSQNCNNSVGSFSCSCNTGYYKYGGIHCSDINECYWNGSTHLCDSFSSVCRDSDGSYSCECLLGFGSPSPPGSSTEDTGDSSGAEAIDAVEGKAGPFYNWSSQSYQCRDNDECGIDKEACGLDRHGLQACVNTLGSFSCICKKGFRIISGISGRDSCTDIDECYWKSPCDTSISTCKNTPGSFSCRCHNGYRIQANSSVCRDVDECSDDEMNDCAKDMLTECQNFPGGYSCNCTRQTGYQLISQGLKCEDVNECEKKHSCGENTWCQNIPGSFVCVCNVSGYTISSDARSCTEDVDECSGKNSCTGQGSECKNQHGSYTCQCRQGFVGDKCSDLDECKDDVRNPGRNPGICDQYGSTTCVNTVGSFKCQCLTGFNFKQKKDGGKYNCLPCNSAKCGGDDRRGYCKVSESQPPTTTTKVATTTVPTTTVRTTTEEKLDYSFFRKRHTDEKEQKTTCVCKFKFYGEHCEKYFNKLHHSKTISYPDKTRGPRHQKRGYSTSWGVATVEWTLKMPRWRTRTFIIKLEACELYSAHKITVSVLKRNRKQVSRWRDLKKLAELQKQCNPTREGNKICLKDEGKAVKISFQYGEYTNKSCAGFKLTVQKVPPRQNRWQYRPRWNNCYHDFSKQRGQNCLCRRC